LHGALHHIVDLGIGNSVQATNQRPVFLEALRAALFDSENNVRTLLFLDHQESEGPLASIYPAELKEKILTAIRSG
jgi:hypothetical protein